MCCTPCNRQSLALASPLGLAFVYADYASSATPNMTKFLHLHPSLTFHNTPYSAHESDELLRSAKVGVVGCPPLACPAHLYDHGCPHLVQHPDDVLAPSCQLHFVLPLYLQAIVPGAVMVNVVADAGAVHAPPTQPRLLQQLVLILLCIVGLQEAWASTSQQLHASCTCQASLPLASVEDNIMLSIWRWHRSAELPCQ